MISGTFFRCNHSIIEIIEDKSYFCDFYVSDEDVYVECYLVIKNNDIQSRTIKHSALMNDDVKLGLLRNFNLIGYDDTLTTNEFKVEKGENRLTVYFIGKYGSVYIKHDRLLLQINIEIIG